MTTDHPTHDHHPHAEAALIASLPAEIQSKLALVTDPDQRRVLLGCLARDEPIPDFAWRPLVDLGPKMAALHNVIQETTLDPVPGEGSFAEALALLPPALQRLVEDACWFAEIGRLGDDDDGEGKDGRSGAAAWTTLLSIAFQGAFHATRRGPLLTPPLPLGDWLVEGVGLDEHWAASLLIPFVDAVDASLLRQRRGRGPGRSELEDALREALGGLLDLAQADPSRWPGEPPSGGPARRLTFFLCLAVGLGVGVATYPAADALKVVLLGDWGRQPPTRRFVFDHLMPPASPTSHGPRGPRSAGGVAEGDEPVAAHSLVRFVRYRYPRTPREGEALARVVADRLRPLGAVAATAAVGLAPGGLDRARGPGGAAPCKERPEARGHA